ncbi:MULTISPECIES: family 16 glycosylhydrolase [unclassified Polaribacter]|uniref:glycoside hydrolase family 16 protein n=1 Tax=unclassified Polaribacter TaxID=196858 RepID=UPI0011BE3648|nr:MULTISPECIES: glycoside hydrolase family 16 protein [unclassified Polaribacter]TXD51931.1 glycoside hydrolase family 16 protein [Polaribacter sp. IC063]TXD59725.1 glycoside hydrolase family 16 protein [Polaribacter sp. IC066]
MNFKNKFKSLSKYFAVVALFGIYSCDTNETQTVTTLENLVWADEFNTDGALDSSKWTYDIGTGQNGWGNNELQYYSDRPENIQVKDGMLHITALKESYMGSTYSSAKLLTKGIYQNTYGRYEARIKLPWGKGLWPAFWLLGDDANGTVIWPQIGEIDIMEGRGQEPTITHGSIHGPGYSAGDAITKSYELENDRFDTDFHIFGIEWGENYINYYVDDVLYNQITPADLPEGAEWVFNDNQFYIILNLAVGGTFVGAPNDETVFPQTMLVDYVKVYQ